MSNSTLSVERERTLIKMKTSIRDNDLIVHNELGEDQLYHMSHLLWKVPSEHKIDDRRLSAELQIIHVQYTTSRQVVISLLFDTIDALQLDPKKVKTCFVDSFEFQKFRSLATGTAGPEIDVPLTQFINFLPFDKYIYYYGSETQPDCNEDVTWIINTSPSVITNDQIAQLKALLDPTTVKSGGNFREI